MAANGPKTTGDYRRLSAAVDVLLRLRAAKSLPSYSELVARLVAHHRAYASRCLEYFLPEAGPQMPDEPEAGGGGFNKCHSYYLMAQPGGRGLRAYKKILCKTPQ